MEKKLQKITSFISQRQHVEAEKCLRQILAQDKDCSEAWHLLSIVHMQKGEIDTAITAISTALSLGYQSPVAFTNLASCYIQKKQYAFAMESADKALTIDCNWVDAWLCLGTAQIYLERLDDALVSLNKGLQLAPNHIELLSWTGFAMMRKKKYSAAIQYFKQIIQQDKNHTYALVHVSNSLLEVGNYQEAIDAIEKVLLFDLNHTHALNIKGICLMHLGKCEEAATIFRKLIKLEPDNLSHTNNLAIACGELLCHQEALELYESLLEKDPVYKWNWSHALLRLGDFSKGFQAYEARLHNASPWAQINNTPPCLTRRWQGKPIDGKTLLVRCEQGLGDCFQFLRYITCLKRYNCKIIIDMPLALHSLFKSLHIPLTCKEWSIPKHDLHVWLMSLPHIFKTDLFTIPPPVLIPNAQLIPVKNRIGIAWKGNPATPKNYQRSLDLKLLTSLLQISEIDYVSLQPDATPEERELLDIYNVEQPQLTSFLDTFHVLEQCERVICADTVIAQLAGSLGIPTWILLAYTPDWRWLLDRTDSPWYPSVRLFRQSIRGSWHEPVETIKTWLLSGLYMETA